MGLNEPSTLCALLPLFILMWRWYAIRGNSTSKKAMMDINNIKNNMAAFSSADASVLRYRGKRNPSGILKVLNSPKKHHFNSVMVNCLGSLALAGTRTGALS